MYNYPKVVEQWIKERFQQKVYDSIDELKLNMIDYGGKIVFDTIVSSGAGSHAQEEFLSYLGYSDEQITKSMEDAYILEEVQSGMDKMSDDLMEYCKENGVDIRDFKLNVDYNQTDGAIDVFLYHPDYCDGDVVYSEEEYAIRIAITEEFECDLSDIVDIDEDTYQVQGYEYKIVDVDYVDDYMKENLFECLYHLDTGFIAQYCDIEEESIKALQDLGKNGNKALLAIMDGTDGREQFLDDAKSWYEYGELLSTDKVTHTLDTEYDSYFLFKME